MAAPHKVFKRSRRPPRDKAAVAAAQGEIIDLTASASVSPANSRSPSVVVVEDADAQPSRPKPRSHSRPAEVAIVGTDEQAESDEPPRKRRAVAVPEAEAPRSGVRSGVPVEQVAGSSMLQSGTASNTKPEHIPSADALREIQGQAIVEVPKKETGKERRKRERRERHQHEPGAPRHTKRRIERGEVIDEAGASAAGTSKSLPPLNSIRLYEIDESLPWYEKRLMYKSNAAARRAEKKRREEQNGEMDKFHGAEELVLGNEPLGRDAAVHNATYSGSKTSALEELKPPTETQNSGKGKERERLPEKSIPETGANGHEAKGRHVDRVGEKMREWDKGKSWDRDEQERSAERERQKRRNKGKGKRQDLPLFFIDDTPGGEPQDIAASDIEFSNDSGLLLPGHIQIATVEEEEEAAVEEGLLHATDDTGSEDDSDSVEGPIQLDLPDKRAGAPRYYEIAERIAVTEDMVCLQCKETGHIARDCPHIICFGCGAIDEHKTRFCQAGTICFNCSKRGHQSADCPEPQKKGPRGRGCEKCGVPTHIALNCPTIWRIYTYLTPEEKLERDSEVRKSKVSILEGGTIECGGPPFCARCAGKGHWADDCPSYPTREPSAFGWYNALTGPYGELDTPSVDFSSTYKEDAAPLPDAPGRAGKAKAKKKLERLADRDDGDDAFDRMQQSRGPDVRRRRNDDRRNEGRHMRFSDQSNWRHPVPTGPRSLLDRIGGHRDQDEPWNRRDDYDRDRYSSRGNYADSRRGRDSDDDYYGPSRRQAPGQRYHGGYSR